ncbi:MAG: M1 family metallopeptidase [Anaerolineales bacterium]
MKKCFASLISLSLILVSCSKAQPSATPPPSTPSATAQATSTPTAAPTLPPTTDALSTAWDDRSIFAAGLVQSQQSTLNELQGASIYHLDIQIAEDMFHIKGVEEVRYTNTETVPLNEIEFRLFPNILGGEMTITNLTVDGQSVAPQYDLQNSLMVVSLSSPLEVGQSAILKMDYAVTVPQSVDLNYGVLAYYQDVLALAHAYPTICVYDDEGWNAEIPPQDGDVTYGDAAFYIVRVTAPAGITLVTSGRDISHDEADQLQTLTVASGPARDFYLAASPKYEEVSQTFDEVTIHSYAYTGFQDGAQFSLEVASKAIDFYSDQYAPYPYTELDIVATPNMALGIEYPGMIAIADRIYDLDQQTTGTPTSIILESTVAHEVGHQWFYNLVGDDQLDDPWLDKSLTQFITLQYYADQYGSNGEQGFRNSLEGRWARVNKENIPIGLPVAGYSGAEYGAIVYGRGPLFFVALREQMGKEAFNSFMKEYTTTLSWGISTPQELQTLAEKHCNCILQPLFNEWVYPP